MIHLMNLVNMKMNLIMFIRLPNNITFNSKQMNKLELKKKSHPQDYHLEDLIYQNLQTLIMTTRQFISNQLIKKNHSKQIQLIKEVLKKKNQNPQDYHLEDLIYQNQQILIMTTRQFINNQQIKINHSKPTQLMRAR